jgi:hypothetical protein
MFTRTKEKLILLSQKGQDDAAVEEFNDIYDNFCIPAAEEGDTTIRINLLPSKRAIELLNAVGIMCKVHNPPPSNDCDCDPRESCRICLPDRYTVLHWEI